MRILGFETLLAIEVDVFGRGDFEASALLTVVFFWFDPGLKLVIFIADENWSSVSGFSNIGFFSCSSIRFHISLKFSDLIDELAVIAPSLLTVDEEFESNF